MRTALELLSAAGDKKAKPEEVRSWADKAVKWSEPYGARWHREVTLAVAEILGDQEGFGPSPCNTPARRSGTLDPKKDTAGVQRRVLEALAAALE